MCSTVADVLCYQMAFTFTSSGDTLVESYWDLVIPGNDITVPFMLVAHVTEPNIVLDQSHINFGTVLLGKNSTQCPLDCYSM